MVKLLYTFSFKVNSNTKIGCVEEEEDPLVVEMLRWPVGIFNWVHRRFNHKDEVSQGATKAEFTGNGKDKLALLENAAFDSVFAGWKEGILAIGTLGFDHALLKLEPNDDTYLCEISRKGLFVGDNGDEDDCGEQEGEIEFPLVLKACKHGFFHDQKDEHPQCDEFSKPNDREDNVDDLKGFATDQVQKKRSNGERITLADLFLADSKKNFLKNKRMADEDHAKLHYNPTESNKKHASNDDRVALISKKKRTKDNTTHTIKKINKMVRKMLKKKIHPDVENQKELDCMYEAYSRT
ncbi:hypothetical protein L1887_36871 [Cichorium endivia]|nr:hypothetical protein L1887_36871 [Cichorium endivia]